MIVVMLMFATMMMVVVIMVVVIVGVLVRMLGAGAFVLLMSVVVLAVFVLAVFVIMSMVVVVLVRLHVIVAAPVYRCPQQSGANHGDQHKHHAAGQDPEVELLAEHQPEHALLPEIER
jgi:hypothetical protein